MKINYCTQKQFEQKTRGKEIIGFGASKTAVQFLQENQAVISRVAYFVDNNTKIVGLTIGNDDNRRMIYSPQKLEEIDDKKTVIVICSNAYEEIIRDLDQHEKLANTECFIYPLMTEQYWTKMKSSEWKRIRLQDAVLEMYQEMMEIEGHSLEKIEVVKEQKRKQFEEQQVILPKLNFLVTTKCTLRCKNCIGMIPFIDAKDADKQQVTEDIENVLRGIDECVVAEIGGGEPLLYPDLAEILTHLINSEKITYIRIPTNGTVLPSKDVTKLLKHHKVSLYISNYGFEKYTNRFLDFVKENSIRYLFCEEMKWIDAGGASCREKPLLQKIVEYSRCSAGKLCKTVYQGRIYHCARNARIMMVNRETQDDSMVLDKSLSDIRIREELLEFFLVKSSAGCDYCDLAKIGAKIIKAGEQLPPKKLSSDAGK